MKTRRYETKHGANLALLSFAKFAKFERRRAEWLIGERFRAYPKDREKAY